MVVLGLAVLGLAVVVFLYVGGDLGLAVVVFLGGYFVKPVSGLTSSSVWVSLKSGRPHRFDFILATVTLSSSPVMGKWAKCWNFSMALRVLCGQ